jgi:cell wall-associated NlpC family hydrolase
MAKAKRSTSHGPAGAVSGTTVVETFKRYIGGTYRWGGGGPFPTPGGDCSGFINWGLGHDLGMTLPGNVKNFNGTWHGPVVAQYATWKGASTVSHSEAQPGDLVIWPGIAAGAHIGCYVGPVTYKGVQYSQGMVSALDTTDGVIETPVHGFGPAGVPVMFRRINAVGGGTGNLLAAQGCGPTVGAAAIIGGCAIWLLRQSRK